MRDNDPEERQSEAIWQRDGETRVGVIQPILLVILIFIGYLVGSFGSVRFPLAFGVNFFWLGIVVQQVGGVLFGAWGVLAGMIFPFWSNADAGAPFVLSLAYLPANFIQGFLPAWVFRTLKLDPRLTSGRDYLFLLLAMAVSNALGALYVSLVVLPGFELADGGSAGGFFSAWFLGNLVPGIVLNFILLKVLSSVVIPTPAFVRRWFS
jgi:hypothetical protein